MELGREHFRAMIFYDFKSGLNQTQSLERLHRAFGDLTPSRATIFRWFQEFRRGRTSLRDEERSGRPATAVTEENIAAVEKMVRKNSQVTIKDIEAALQIGSPAVSKILHNYLRVRKVLSRWVPHTLTDEQKRIRVKWCQEMLIRFDGGKSRRISDIITGDETWIYQFDPENKCQSTMWIFFPDENPPTKVKRPRSVGRKMVATFFSKSGHIATVPLEEQRTFTAQWYTTVCLPKVFRKLQEWRPTTGLRGTILHHDNVSAHTANVTIQFLESTEVELMTHPPYSPDLAPCDYFLLPIVKNRMRGRSFSSPEEAVCAYENELTALEENEWKECFKEWFTRMQKCIECHGDYFEKIQ
ncbi:histone-lysine N-methyltransferase SETMAR-like [Nycticebus coucang]|uniref:histone-lysine N-methyltransferase SETMAR-like n=1 Tax=Nycticebus coucang TaxID=9470 RepID=UPI00234D7170|nr:histone-lysine N-methyltransferase SETMAR-like [Nycticebus coucang]XP_053411310.1 histone-lysine N-methyltransferase SETMAR-like [Nycticebus coucang]